MRDERHPAMLRGRDREWQQIIEILDGLDRTGPDRDGHRTGRPTALVIEGPPGSGRSRLLAELAAEVRRRYGVVFEHRGWSPPAVVRELSHQWCQLAERHAAAAQDGGAAREPLLVAWDDPPWTDPGLLTALEVAPAAAIFWALTRRQGELHAEPPASAAVVRVELRRLTEPAVAELTADLLEAAPSAAVTDLARAGCGNPAAIVDLMAGLREEALVEVRAGTAELTTRRLPERTRQRLRRQLGQISATARHLVQVASAVGISFDLADLIRHMPHTAAGLLPATEEVLTCGLLTCDDDRLAFGHELVRAVVADSVPRWMRGALLDEVAGLAHAAPATGYQPPVTAVLDTLFAAGRLADVADLARGALAHPRPAAVAADLRCRLAQALLFAGRAGESAAAVAPVLTDPGVPSELRRHALAASLLAQSVDDPERARIGAQDVLTGPAAAPGDPAWATAATVVCYVARAAGDLTEAVRLARAAVAALDGSTPAVFRAYAELALAGVLADAGDRAGAEAVLTRTMDETERRGLEPHRTWALISRADHLVRVGRPDEARGVAASAAEAAGRMGAALLTPMAAAVLTRVALRVGEPAAAALIERSMIGPRRPAPWSGPHGWFALVATAERDGPRNALDLLNGPDADLVSRPDLHLREPGAAAWLVRLARAVGDTELRRAAVRAARDLAARNPGFPTLAAAARHAAGLADGDTGALARAAREHTDPWAAAWAAEDAGRCVAERGGPAAPAVAHLETALRRFGAIGAERDAARVFRQLKTMGVRHRRGPRPATRTTGWESLTPQERTIAYLTSQGMTNRQIAARVHLSPHTVNYHLRRIYRKLDVRSRIELARRAPAQPRSDAPPST